MCIYLGIASRVWKERVKELTKNSNSQGLYLRRKLILVYLQASPVNISHFISVIFPLGVWLIWWSPSSPMVRFPPITFCADILDMAIVLERSQSACHLCKTVCYSFWVTGSAVNNHLYTAIRLKKKPLIYEVNFD